MDSSGIIFLVVTALVVAAIVVVLSRGRRPGQASAEGVPPGDIPDTTNERFYRGVDRPAGPDAETNM